MKEYVSKFKELLEEKNIIDTTITLITWELETIVPPKGIELLAKQIGYFSMKSYNIITSSEMKEILAYFNQNKESLNPVLQRETELLSEEMERMDLIPPDEYKAYKELIAESQSIWKTAKETNNFNMFKKNLKKIFEYSKKFATYEFDSKDEQYKQEKVPYDILLEQYEKGMDTKQLDIFFDTLKKEIVPLLAEVLKKQRTKKIKFPIVSVDSQKKISKFLSSYVGFDYESGVIGESEHPYTTSLNKNDVRFTTKYTKNLPTASIFSTIHESGHGIYEQQTDDKLTNTILGGGSSMGLHESQSRFYENMIGRNYYFWKGIAENSVFSPIFSKMNLNGFYLGINTVAPSLIRIESDELTYSLHIMVRYEIEKGIFNNEIKIDDLQNVWSKKMYDYLGITPKNDTEGVLQDVHWADGLIGYFPSYAIGNAYSAQIFNQLKKDLNFEKILENGELYKIKDWLKIKIHKYGALRNSKDIIKKVTGEELNPIYYINYLRDKFLNI
ncbi:MAG: carboxypeptidase M32 [Fusobacteriaceae bacterium]|nr:carboxypeptidase M32 [Fusobacteriaceae bacterium]